MRLSNLFVLLVLFFTACKKDQPMDPAPPVESFQNGILVLNEGLFQQNNSSLSWINKTTGITNNAVFEQKTDRLLGDTGNDLQRYGNKIYIVVNVSSTVEVLDATTGKSIQQIEMVEGGVPKQPRYVTFSGNKAYVSCYDGFVDVIDTTTLAIETRIQVGANPEELVVSNELLYVANSGGLNYPNVDSTVSVIDLSSNTEVSKITVGKNPGGMEVDAQGNIYVVARGNYSTIPSRLVKIDPTNANATTVYPFDCSGIERMGNYLLYTSSTTNETHLHLFNTLDATIQTDFIDVSGITTLYKLRYIPSVNQIFICDAQGYTVSGKVYVYTGSGSFVDVYTVGLNPSQIIYYD